MSRGWKPGDVAVINDTTGGPEHIALCTGEGRTGDALWNYGKGEVWSSVSRARPLVVIDPEDREQVDRLCKALVERMHAAGDRASAANGVHPATVTAALREFADPTPPKPEEPTGLGAVVATDEDGDYIRVSVQRRECWQNVQSGSVWQWGAVDAVRVLSEGVQAGESK